MPYIFQNSPVIIPTEDDKLIEEHFGKAASGNDQISIARMEAPAGWEEPFQTPEFDEYTLVCSGKKQIEVEGKKILLSAGESILIKRGTRVRYSNPFSEECKYWSICTPAFDFEKVNREIDK